MPEGRESAGESLLHASRNAVRLIARAGDLALHTVPPLVAANLMHNAGSPEAAPYAAAFTAMVTSGVIDRAHLGSSNERRTREGLIGLGRAILWGAASGIVVALGQTPETQGVLHSLQQEADYAFTIVQSYLPTPLPTLMPEPTAIPPTLVPTIPPIPTATPIPVVNTEGLLNDAPLCISAGAVGALLAASAMLRSRIHGPRR